VSGNFVMRKAGTVEVTLSGKDGGLTIGKNAAIEGGVLRVKLAAGYTPSAGDELSVIRSGNIEGRFDDIVLEGHETVPVYGKTGLSLRIKG
jgi:hypothetical protein